MGRFEEDINVWPQTILHPVWPKETKVKSSARGEMSRKAPDSDFRKSRVMGAWFDSVHTVPNVSSLLYKSHAWLIVQEIPLNMNFLIQVFWSHG